MKPKSAFKHLIAALVAIAIVGPSSTWAAGGKDQNKSADGAPAGGADMYMPPKSFTSTIQLKEHIIRLQKVPLTQRQSGYSEALVSTADKILESNPPDSLREFAVLNLLDGLHHWADVDKNAEADKRLAELSTKYSTDANKKIALAAAYFALEQKVINPSELKHEEIPKVLDEAKAALNGKALAAKHERMCNGTNTLINYLDTDEEAERRFKDFSRIFATSTDQNIAKLGNTMRTAKRDPSVVKTAEKPAAIATTSPADPAAMTPAPEKIEPAEDWVKRMEAKIVAFAGPEHDEEYLKEKSKFLEKYPSDPLRWRWSIMDARAR